MSEWTVSELNGITSFQKGRKVEVSEYHRDGFAPYLGAGVLAGGEATEFADTSSSVQATCYDVLMLWDGERSGLVGKGRPGVVSSTVAKLTPKAGMDTSFLYYALDAKFSWIQGRRTGTGVPHVPKDLGRILRIPHPTDQTEQKCIAEILTTIDEAIEQTEALIAKTLQIKAGLMHDLFTRGITKDGQLRTPREEAPRLYKESPIGWIPIEWDWQNVDKLLARTACPMRSGPFGSSLLKDELVDNGVPLLGIDNIFTECFVADYRRFVTHQKFMELNRYAVFPRDVIITIMGTVGRCCVVPDEIGNALSSKHIWTMTFDQNRILPELVCWQLNYAPWVKAWITRQSQGAVMEAIQSSTLRTLQLPVPPMDEQLMLRERYFGLETRISSEKNNLHKLQRLKAGLMHDLLTGCVRVQIGQFGVATI